MLQLKLGKNSLPKPVAKDWLSLDPREISEIKRNLKMSRNAADSKSHTHLAPVVGRLDINGIHRINR